MVDGQAEHTGSTKIQKVDMSLEKGRILVEANEYADKCVRRTLFGKNKELAKQRIVVMYLLDEIDRLVGVTKF